MNLNKLILYVVWHISYIVIYVNACGDVQESFSINSVIWITHKKRCSWANEGKRWKCSISEMQVNCPSTCNLCPTISPAPTIPVNDEVTKSPSQNPPPSAIPGKVIQIGPFAVPEAYIEIAVYVAIILLVIFLSCYRSGDGNKRKPSGTHTRRGGRGNRYDGTYIEDYNEESYVRPSRSNRREKYTNRARR